MLQTLPFNENVADYEAWFDQYPFVFLSEVMAIKEFLPKEENIKGVEVGTGTGRFADALGIMEAVEPADNMRRRAIERGINARDAEAAHLPYHDLSFDFVLMAFSISYFDSIHEAFKEAHRVLKHNGCLIAGFLDKDSSIGREYEAQKKQSVFYKQATFYGPLKVVKELKWAGFKNFSFCQTLFNKLEEVRELQLPKPGYGEGSFVVVKALKT